MYKRFGFNVGVAPPCLPGIWATTGGLPLQPRYLGQPQGDCPYNPGIQGNHSGIAPTKLKSREFM